MKERIRPIKSELGNAIEQVRKALGESIERGEPPARVLELSVMLDQLIEQYLDEQERHLKTGT